MLIQELQLEPHYGESRDGARPLAPASLPSFLRQESAIRSRPTLLESQKSQLAYTLSPARCLPARCCEWGAPLFRCSGVAVNSGPAWLHYSPWPSHWLGLLDFHASLCLLSPCHLGLNLDTLLHLQNRLHPTDHPIFISISPHPSRSLCSHRHDSVANTVSSSRQPREHIDKATHNLHTTTLSSATRLSG